MLFAKSSTERMFDPVLPRKLLITVARSRVTNGMSNEAAIHLADRVFPTPGGPEKSNVLEGKRSWLASSSKCLRSAKTCMSLSATSPA